MGKVKFYLKNPTAEESIIFLVYRFDNIYFKYYTGERVVTESWDSKKQRPTISRSYPENTDVDRQLSKYEFYLKDLINELKRKKVPITKELLKENLEKEFKESESDSYSSTALDQSFIKYLEKYISECEKGTRLTPLGTKYSTGTIKAYKNLKSHVKDFEELNSKKLQFKDITIDFYDDILCFFHDNEFATNTIGNQIKNIKTVMNAAREEGYHNNTEYQRKKFKKITEESDSIYLSEEELEIIYNLDLSGNKKLEKIRDLFVVGARTALRFSDFSNLRENNFIQNEKGSFLRVHTQKTNEEVIVPLKREVIEIFNKYEGRLPRNVSNQKMNEYLKKIGEKAELKTIITKVTTKGGVRKIETFEKWELISSHTARRSAATNLFLAGLSTISIMKLTGHKTERSFMKYIKISKEDNAYKMAESDYFRNDKAESVKLKIVS